MEGRFALPFSQPRELFLTAGKEGSMLNALLADAAVVISVALESDHAAGRHHGVSRPEIAPQRPRVAPMRTPSMISRFSAIG